MSKEEDLPKTSVFSSFVSYIRSFDAYGQPIVFNYKGSDSFQTTVGAIISILVNITLVTCVYYRGEMLYNLDIWNLST